MEKKSTGKTVIIIILLLIVLGLGGYIAYDKFLAKEPKTEIKEVEKPKQIEETNFNLDNKKIVQALIGNDNYTLYVTAKGEAFLTIENSGNEDETVKTAIANLQSQYQDNTIEGYCQQEEACENGDVVKSIKLDIDNVVAAYDTTNGQDVGGWMIVFLKNDGTISTLNIGAMISGENMEIKNNVGNLKNIVTIAQSVTTGMLSGYHYAIAIEKDGTQHNLAQLLYK